jgi:hypothetical protein
LKINLSFSLKEMHILIEFQNKEYKIKVTLCLINETVLHEGVWRSGDKDPHVLDLGSFTPRPFYSRVRSAQYPMERRLGGAQSRSGRRGEEKILDPTGTRTPIPRASGP